MLILIACAIGAYVGWRRARARGGDKFDRLQYAAAHAILFALLATAAAVALQRLGGV
jgi:hypothetical protein